MTSQTLVFMEENPIVFTARSIYYFSDLMKSVSDTWFEDKFCVNIFLRTLWLMLQSQWFHCYFLSQVCHTFLFRCFFSFTVQEMFLQT